MLFILEPTEAAQVDIGVNGRQKLRLFGAESSWRVIFELNGLSRECTGGPRPQSGARLMRGAASGVGGHLCTPLVNPREGGLGGGFRP